MHSDSEPKLSGDWLPAGLERAWTRRLAPARPDQPERRIWLGLPDAPAPAGGFPLVLVLDGADYFTAMLDTVRRLSRRPAATGVAPAIVLGVDTVETGPARVARRRSDFNWAPPADAAEAADGALAPAGSDFLDLILTRILPLLSDLSIDQQKLGLFGHSIAGNFALHALAARPAVFQTWGAVSPSLWWNPGRISAALAAADLSGVRLLLGVGEKEEGDTARAHARPRRMVGNARDLAAQLTARLTPDQFQFAVFPDEDHGSVVNIAMVRFLRLACPPDQGV